MHCFLQDSQVHVFKKQYVKPMEQVAQSSGGPGPCHTSVDLAHFVCLSRMVGSVSRTMTSGLRVTARLSGMLDKFSADEVNQYFLSSNVK